MTQRLHFHFSLSCIGEGNGNPLQFSCLENPRDGGSLVGCCLWGRTESDTTDATYRHQQQCPPVDALVVSFLIQLHANSLQSCLTLHDPMGCSPTGSSAHEILQARILEWVAMLSSRGSSWMELESSAAPALQAASLLLNHI